MKKRILTLVLAASILAAGNGTVKAENGTYVRGYLSETTNLRDKPSGNLIGKLDRNSYVEGYKIGNWIKLFTGNYVYDFGLIKANVISGYISRPTYIRDYNTNKIVGVYQLLEKVDGVKEGNWIKFVRDGRLLKVYDFGLLKGEKVSGYLSESTNIREYSTGKLVDRYPTFTKVSGIKDGNWIMFEKNGKLLKVYDFGLLKGEKVSGYLSESTNIREYSTGKLVDTYQIFTKISGIKDGNWIMFEKNGKLLKVYDFGLLKGEKVEGYLLYNTNVRTEPKGKLITKYGAGTFISGIKDGNWIRFIHEGKFASIYDFGLSKSKIEVEPKPQTPKPQYSENNKRDKPIRIEGDIPKGTYYPVFEKLNGFITAQDAYDQKNPIKTFEPGNYYVYATFGDLINISKYKNSPGAWINSFYNRREKRAKRTTKPQEFINKIAPIAKTIADNNDLFPSVMIAQAILESGYGTAILGEAPYNNLFGIKGMHNGESVAIPTYEFTPKGKRYLVVAHFKRYETYYESLLDYAALLTGKHDKNAWRYKFYFKARRSQNTSYKGATAHLTGRYATSPYYGDSLNRLIKQYNLDKYDSDGVVEVPIGKK